MRLLFLISFVALFFWKGQAVTFTVKYTCNGFVLTFSAYEADGKLKVVYVATKYTSCGSEATAGTKISFTVPAAGGTQATPATGTIPDNAAAATACGYSGASTRTVTLHLLQKKGIISNGDGKTQITCETNSKPEVEQTATIASITGDLTNVDATKGVPGLTLAVINGNTGDDALHNAVPPNPITLETNLVIIARLAIAVGSTNKVLIETCTAVPAGADSPSIKIITTNCPDTSDEVYAVNTNPQIASSHPATNPTLYMVRTPAFPAFRIPDFNGIDIKCTVLFCASGNDCNPPTCQTSARRRRAADPTQGLRNQTMTTTIYIGAHPRNQDTSARAQDISVGDCLSHVSFISVVAILTVLLVVSLAVSVFFCSKLIRQNNNNQQKEAYPNPAYKA